MLASYAIDVDPERNLVRIAMSGFFTDADLHRFVADRNAAHARLTCAPNMHDTINDVRGMKIQSQEMVDAFRRVLSDPRHKSRRLAFVVAPTLARSQLARALGGRGARVFDDTSAAEAWVAMAGGDAAAA
jgi:hypothetical protein